MGCVLDAQSANKRGEQALIEFCDGKNGRDSRPIGVGTTPSSNENIFEGKWADCAQRIDNMFDSDELHDVHLTFAASIDHTAYLNRRKLREKLAHGWVIKIALFSVYFAVGCIVFNHLEGWGPLKSISFAIVTICTIGYGYRHPSSDESRMFTIFYLIIGVGMVHFYVAKAINERFVHALVSSQSITQPELVGQKYVHHRRWMVFYVFMLCALVFLGALCLHALEPDWTFITALYFAVETTSTVGYGDVPMENHHYTQTFLAVYIVVSTILSAFALNNFQLLQAQNQIIDRFNKLLEKEKDISPLLQGSESLSEAEFVLVVLQHTGRLDANNDVAPWVAKFQALKLDEHGRANRENLEKLAVQESNNAAHSQQVLDAYTQMTMARTLRGDTELSLFRKARSSSKNASELSSLLHSPVSDTSSDEPDT